jgi:hypothetical protein
MRRFLCALLVASVRAYQLGLSPLLPAACRFYPSCSHYAIQAFESHGPGRGLAMTLSRQLRCHPFHAGGYDPVP